MIYHSQSYQLSPMSHHSNGKPLAGEKSVIDQSASHKIMAPLSLGIFHYKDQPGNEISIGTGYQQAERCLG